MFQIIIERNNQIRDMEIEMEKILLEKEQAYRALVPIPTQPVSATMIPGPSTASTTSTLANDQSQELAKAMDNLFLKEKEIAKLHAQGKVLSEKKIKIDNLYVAKLQKTHQLTQKIQQMQSESVMDHFLAKAKEYLWADIIESVTRTWPSILIIYEQLELVHNSKDILKQVRLQLG